MKFKLLSGLHSDEDGNNFAPGSVVETSADLAAAFGKEKFERIPDDSDPQPIVEKVIAGESEAVADPKARRKYVRRAKKETPTP